MLDKIKNNIFLKSTLVLLIGGTIGKAVGFILKIGDAKSRTKRQNV